MKNVKFWGEHVMFSVVNVMFFIDSDYVFCCATVLVFMGNVIKKQSHKKSAVKCNIRHGFSCMS